MEHLIGPLTFVLLLWLGMLLLLEIGRRVGVRQRKESEGAGTGFGAIEGAVFGLLGLLIAFTFSGAASRFDTRRALIVEETNDIGTAYLRLNLLPQEAQTELRDLFRKYVDARLAFYREILDPQAAQAQMARVNQLQSEIWTRAVKASQQTGTTTASMLLLPALNSMFDIVTTRSAALEMHPPKIIFGMLAVLALACSLLAGYGMAASPRSWLHTIAFAAILTLAVYLIIDLEYPRAGLVQVSSFDQMLIDLRNSMK